ncbi:hypothetical protein ROD_p1091 (plasmid) [Citrobacter rodentium ICC168]|uniref:Uncharacterized protein n=1 Tax=Citrobacter rodentium (strain ICC168) TaxID=637910 RepID=D2TV85_CITRI|nr:hypothetical protein ROD_p1091 [Citrobacter rodentium ICC168]
MTLQYPLPARGRGLYQNRIKEKSRKSRTISHDNNKIRYNKPINTPRSRIWCKKISNKKNKSLFYKFSVLFFFFLC